MGQGFKQGEQEWNLIVQPGDGNLLPPQPAQADLKQLQDDIAAIKKKIGM